MHIPVFKFVCHFTIVLEDISTNFMATFCLLYYHSDWVSVLQNDIKGSQRYNGFLYTLLTGILNKCFNIQFSFHSVPWSLFQWNLF